MTVNGLFGFANPNKLVTLAEHRMKSRMKNTQLAYKASGEIADDFNPVKTGSGNNPDGVEAY